VAQGVAYTRSDSDWVFPSYRCKGKVPRFASTCGKKYLRPAAVTAGVIKADESVRFGWHSLRHSLATFFGSQEIPVQVIQKMLRQKKLGDDTPLHAWE
jgi:site-specific recombinase XerD